MKSNTAFAGATATMCHWPERVEVNPCHAIFYAQYPACAAYVVFLARHTSSVLERLSTLALSTHLPLMAVYMDAMGKNCQRITDKPVHALATRLQQLMHFCAFCLPVL